MRRQRSYRQIERDFRHVFSDLNGPPPSPSPKAMTPGRVRLLNAHEQARMRREAEKDRLREIVREVLAEEERTA